MNLDRLHDLADDIHRAFRAVADIAARAANGCTSEHAISAAHAAACLR
jgi:hypothetical protein